MNQNIFIIIPAFNEEKNIAQVIKNLLEHNYQIVVVDDCSTDNTFEILKQFPITVLKHEINRGQGAALQTGTDFALKNNAEIIVHFDADGQYLVNEIQQTLVSLLNNEVDIILGSRFLQKNKKMPFAKRKIIHPVSRVINRLITGIKLTDAHCGYRVLSNKAGQKIKIFQDRMSHNTEIISQIKKNNLRFKEVPVTVIYNEFGQGVGSGFKILKEICLSKLSSWTAFLGVKDLVY